MAHDVDLVGGSDTYTNPMLNSNGLIINTLHNTLICMECGCSINHMHVREHFIGRHKAMKPSKDLNASFQRMLAADYPHLVYPPAAPVRPVRVIYGLKPPLDQYLVCSSCHRGYKKGQSPVASAFSKHVCLAGQPNPRDRKGVESMVQTFEQHTRSPYFSVHPTTETVLDVGAWAAYKEDMAKRPPPSTAMAVPDNYRVLEQFLRKEEWVQHIRDVDPRKLKGLIAVDPNDGRLPKLAQHCRAYLQCHQDSLQSYHARRLISTRPSAEWVFTLSCFCDD
jgi:hypothetical protein